ncbi:MAG: hypothetical protein SPG61_00415 [Arcanobacterium sp.]|nr:hypothetical protein [Arcanobacterium sp.]
MYGAADIDEVAVLFLDMDTPAPDVFQLLRATSKCADHAALELL